MGYSPKAEAVWAVQIEDSDWKDEDNNIRPNWLPMAFSPEYAEDGFEDVFYPLQAEKPLDMHSFYYCGDYDHRSVFVGVSLWETTWCGESPALEPTEEQRQAVQAFVDRLGLDKKPALHVLLSYG